MAMQTVLHVLEVLKANKSSLILIFIAYMLTTQHKAHKHQGFCILSNCASILCRPGFKANIFYFPEQKSELSILLVC